MPEVKNNYAVSGLNFEQLISEAREALTLIGAKITDDVSVGTGPNQRMVKSTIESVWGWGDYDLQVVVTEGQGAMSFTLSGYITQWGVSPLTKSMDKYLAVGIVLSNLPFLGLGMQFFNRMLRKAKSPGPIEKDIK